MNTMKLEEGMTLKMKFEDGRIVDVLVNGVTKYRTNMEFMFVYVEEEE